jgi:transketolase
VIPGKSGQKYIEATHEKMHHLNQLLSQHNFDGYVEADGGVTLDNIGSCFADGARAFVGGSAIIGQQDVRGVIREFRNKIAYARRKMLIQKAFDLGGKELVAKWIDLHVIGEKKNQLNAIARELGYT